MHGYTMKPVQIDHCVKVSQKSPLQTCLYVQNNPPNCAHR